MVRATTILSVFVPAATTLMKQSLQGVDSAAVCTDGSPASYYFQASASQALQSANVWIVYLQGGGWCYDKKSCESRCGTTSSPSTGPRCSSKGYGPTIKASGLFSPVNDAILANANKAYVMYCTSDAHMGNGEKFGFQFRGGVVVQAVLRDLVATHGLGSGLDRDLIIFGGGSAGGRGSMVHLDYVPEMLGSAASNVDVVGFLDSPAWIDIQPFDMSFPGFPYMVQQVHSYANVEHLGSACAEAYPTEQWKCMFGQYRLPTLTTPYFLVASQADEFQLRNNVGHKPSSSQEKSYAENFAALTRDLVESLEASSFLNTVYSWQCYNHNVGESHSGFDELTVGGNTMGQALQQFLGWLPETTSPALTWIDTCTDFDCGSGCTPAASKKTGTVV